MEQVHNTVSFHLHVWSLQQGKCFILGNEVMCRASWLCSCRPNNPIASKTRAYCLRATNLSSMRHCPITIISCLDGLPVTPTTPFCCIDFKSIREMITRLTHRAIPLLG